MTENIRATDLSIATLFSSEFSLEIPSYQYPFKWTVDEAVNFFDNLHNAYTHVADQSYFLGTMVLIKKDNDSHSVVIDGHHRLASLTILLAAITERLSEQDKDSFLNYVQEAEQPSRDQEPQARLILQTEDRDFFTQRIQNLIAGELPLEESLDVEPESRRNIKEITQALRTLLANHFNDDAQALKHFGTFVVQRCYVVALFARNLTTAYQALPNTDSSCINLLASDIIKTTILEQVKTKTSQDYYAEEWRRMEKTLGRRNLNNLLGYTRMIFAKQKRKEHLYDEFCTHVLTKVDDIPTLFDDVLEPFAKALRLINAPYDREESDLRAPNPVPRWLNRINISEWIPVAILFLSKHGNDDKETEIFFNKLAQLAAYSIMNKMNVNERIERYNTVLSALETGAWADAIELTATEKKKRDTRAN